MNKKLTFLLACCCGLSVANIYYIQPLLVILAEYFNYHVTSMSTLATLVQLSYALGLFLFVPLGDRISRKKLIICLLLFNMLSLLLMACANQFVMLVIASIFIGLSSVSAQIIIPAVSILASPESKGKQVATVMSGLFAGIVLARTLSGLIAHYMSWRMVFGVAAILDLVMIIGIYNFFPYIKAHAKGSYLKLLGSMFTIFPRQKTLVYCCVAGALMFGAFSAFWGALAYLLSLAPYHYGSNITGLFGLAGLVGMFASKYIGMFADKWTAKTTVTVGACIMILAFIFISQARLSLLFLLVGVLILDLGGRAGLIGNQLRLFELSVSLRSRLNTMFMAVYFIGGAIGTRFGSEIAVQTGWNGLAILGVTLGFLVVVFNCVTRCLWKIKHASS